MHMLKIGDSIGSHVAQTARHNLGMQLWVAQHHRNIDGHEKTCTPDPWHLVNNVREHIWLLTSLLQCHSMPIICGRTLYTNRSRCTIHNVHTPYLCKSLGKQLQTQRITRYDIDPDHIVHIILRLSFSTPPQGSISPMFSGGR
jgi:hypothetical protein